MANGSVCQSCSMPMQKPGDFGSNADGSRSWDYCSFCFQKGAFTSPGLSLGRMIERLVFMAPRMGMKPEEARKMAEETLPRLKRWKK